MPSYYHHSSQALNGDRLQFVGHHIQIDGRICCFCQSPFKFDENIVAVLRISVKHNLTFQFRLKKNSHDVPQWLHGTFIGVPYMKAGRTFQLCPNNTRGVGSDSCVQCHNSPVSWFYHLDCLHGLEFFRSKLGHTATHFEPAVTISTAVKYISQLTERWHLLFEIPQINWENMDIEALMCSLYSISSHEHSDPIIPFELSNLPRNSRTMVLKELVSSSETSAKLILKAMKLQDLARLLFLGSAPTTVALMGNIYATMEDRLRDLRVVGIDCLAARKPGDGPSPWYLHLDEMKVKKIKGMEIVHWKPLRVPFTKEEGFGRFTLWDIDTLPPATHLNLYNPKYSTHIDRENREHKENWSPLRMRTLNLVGSTGLTFFCSQPIVSEYYRGHVATGTYSQIRAIHAHYSHNSSAMETYKTIPLSQQNKVTWLYVPLVNNEIQKTWFREDLAGVLLVLQTPRGLIHIGPGRQKQAFTSEHTFATSTVKTLIYSLPEDGFGIEVFGAVTKEEKTEIVRVEEIEVPPGTVRPSSRGNAKANCVQNWASLEDVQYVEVYEEDSDDKKYHRMCWGMLFVYKDGSSSSVGQRKVGFNTKVIRYDQPTHIYKEIRDEHSTLKFGENFIGARFFFSGESENTKSSREYLKGWGVKESEEDEAYNLWEQELMTKKKELKGELRWDVFGIDGGVATHIEDPSVQSDLEEEIIQDEEVTAEKNVELDSLMNKYPRNKNKKVGRRRARGGRRGAKSDKKDDVYSEEKVAEDEAQDIEEPEPKPKPERRTPRIPRLPKGGRSKNGKGVGREVAEEEEEVIEEPNPKPKPKRRAPKPARLPKAKGGKSVNSDGRAKNQRYRGDLSEFVF